MSRSWHPAAQRRLTRWFGLGILLGLLVATLISARWIQSGSGVTISVLGAGKYVSVLVTHNQRRVLIASGSDGSAFSNAIGKALPPIAGSIDVLLIDPRASADVIERAQSLSAKLMLQLPAPDNGDDPRAVQRSFSMDLSGGVVISLRTAPSRSWTATILTPTGPIVVAPDSETAQISPIRISLDGSLPEAADQRARVDIGPFASGQPGTGPHAVVRSGNVLSITVDETGFRFPKDDLTTTTQASARTISRNSEGTLWSNSARTASRSSESRSTSSPVRAIAFATRSVFR